MKYLITLFCITSFAGCTLFESETVIVNRTDNASPLSIELEGSLQNASWAPDSTRIVFTRYRDGFNAGVSDLYIYNTESKEVTELVADGRRNMVAPGNAWGRFNGRIVFTSDATGHNELYVISPDSVDKDIIQLTSREAASASYAGFTFNGGVSFVSHDSLGEGAGRIMTITGIFGSGTYKTLSSLTQDCDKPNWSTMADVVLFECTEGSQTDLWIRNGTGFASRRITETVDVSETGAVWSKNTTEILYSLKNGNNIFLLDVNTDEVSQLTMFSGYSGRPAMSPDSTTFVFESGRSNSTGANGSDLWILDYID